MRRALSVRFTARATIVVAVDTQARIAEFLSEGPFAVVGASTNREKYGNKVLRCYLQHGLDVSCVHPREKEIEGLACDPDLASLVARLGRPVRGLSVITPPAVTEGLIEEAARLGIQRLWLQPGAESSRALQRAEAHGLTVIAGGPCLLVALGFRDV